MQFYQFMGKVHASKPRPGGLFTGKVLALDPGETTGWSVWEGGEQPSMVACGQLDTWDKEAKPSTSTPIEHCVTNFPQLLSTYNPTTAVLESYRVYDWKTESHAWSDVPTLRIIGSMETRLHDLHIPYYFQTAQQAKNFVSDEMLSAFGFYTRGQRHSRDSMRHAIYFILFGG